MNNISNTPLRAREDRVSVVEDTSYAGDPNPPLLFASPPAGGDMYKADNLSLMGDYSICRSNLGLGSLATQSGTFSGSHAGSSSGTNTGDNSANSLYSGLVTNATHTGDVTGSTALTLVTAQSGVHTWAATQTFTVSPVFTDQSGSRTALGLGSLATQSGTFSGSSSGNNTGDNAVNTLYSGLVTNAAHTGDVTGSTALTLATAQPAVHTWALAQTFTVAPVFTNQSGTRSALGLGTLATQSGTFSGTSSGTNTGDNAVNSLYDDGTRVLEFLLSNGTDNWGYTPNSALYSINMIRVSEVLCGDESQTGYPIEAIIMTEGGAGYTTGIYSFTLSGGTGSSAAGKIQVANGKVVMCQMTTQGSGYRIIPAQIKWSFTYSKFYINVGNRGITGSGSQSQIDALFPNGISAVLPNVFPEGTTLSGRTWDATEGKWWLTFSASPIWVAPTTDGYFNVAFGVPRVNVTGMGSGGGFDYRWLQGTKRKYRINPGSYYWQNGFELVGVNNVEIDCRGVHFYTDQINSAGIAIGDTCTGVTIVGMSQQNRYGLTDISSRGDGMPWTLSGSYNTLRDCSLEAGGDWGLIVGGSYQRSYGLTVQGYRSRSSWGDFMHVYNVDGFVMTNFEAEHMGDDGLALYSDDNDISNNWMMDVLPPTFTGYISYININNGGTGYNNGTFLCSAVSGAGQANITVAGGIITGGAIVNGGSSYSVAPLFNLTPCGGGVGGSVSGHLTWSAVTGSWTGANYNMYQRLGYATSITLIDSQQRLSVSFAFNHTNGGSLANSATIINGGYGYTSQPSLNISKAGKNISISGGVLKRGAWRGILIGPWGWENVNIANVVYEDLGGHGITIGSGTDSRVDVFPLMRGINISAVAFKGVGVPQHRADVSRNIANVFNVDASSFFGITSVGGDNAVFTLIGCSNSIVGAVSTVGAVDYSGSSSNTNCGRLSTTAI